MEDKNGKKIEKGSIVDLHQTVNGQNIFVVLDIDNLDVRYAYDLTRKYEYDVNGLFKTCPFNGGVEYEIIGNIGNKNIN